MSKRADWCVLSGEAAECLRCEEEERDIGLMVGQTLYTLIETGRALIESERAE